MKYCKYEIPVFIFYLSIDILYFLYLSFSIYVPTYVFLGT